jgi:ribonuclease HI
MYTDGSCDGNPGPGGWAAVLLVNNEEWHYSGNSADTTNNRMELTAAIAGIQALSERLGADFCKNNLQLEIFTDSRYVQQGITSWIKQWQKRNWRTASGTPVKNQDLWQALVAALQTVQVISWQWVPAHVGIEYNERADQLAKTAVHAITIGKTA